MKLYEMTADFAELFDNYDAIVNIEFTPDGKGGFVDDDGNPVDPEERRREMQQAWFDTLDGMEQELVCKAENVAVYIKNMESEAKTLKAEEDKLKARRQAKENAAKRMREYLYELTHHDQLTTAVLPVGDGVTVSVKGENLQ